MLISWTRVVKLGFVDVLGEGLARYSKAAELLIVQRIFVTTPGDVWFMHAVELSLSFCSVIFMDIPYNGAVLNHAVNKSGRCSKNKETDLYL